MAHIPVEKVVLSASSYTFKSALREVVVVRVLRYPATYDRNLNRWHYQVDIRRHPDIHPEAICVGVDGAYRCNVIRRQLNPKWKPPEFPAGCDVVEITA